jgi:hypothetical protein
LNYSKSATATKITQGSREEPSQVALIEEDMMGEDMMDNVSNQGKVSDVDEAGHGWKASKGKKAKRHKKT